jgi:ubiquinone/menaquinone biosynthesis C-methylase UbiE
VSSILEVGCGDGTFLSSEIAATFSQASLAGIDVSQKAINTARRVSGPHIRYQVAPIEDAPFADETFDLVFACMTFHHWSDKQRGLLEVSRILKPQGVFLMGDPITDGLLRYRWLNWTAEKLDGGAFTHPDDLERMLSAAHLRLISVTPVPHTSKTLSVCVIGK